VVEAKRQLHLNVGLGASHAAGAWRRSCVDGVPTQEFEQDAEITRIAERAKLDAVFIADIIALHPGFARSETFLEPVTLMSALAAVTDRIGLIATVSTTYFEPYNLARQFASLDLISGGRAGWNLVTTIFADAARQFGSKPHPAHEDRYRDAEEFLEVVTKLWESWEDEAVIVDTESGVYVDPAKVHEIVHTGRLHQVAGPLNVRPSPQGHPVVMQAGASATGAAFAARYADAVFTTLQTLEQGQAYYADLKGQMARHGREPSDLVILPSMTPVVGETEAKAKETREELLALGPDLTSHFGTLNLILGRDVSDLPLDSRFPPIEIQEGGGGSQHAVTTLNALVERDRMTVRDVLKWMATGGHRTIVGAPEQIADDIEAWFRGKACDGFTLRPPDVRGFELFTESVIPELQRRGLFRTEYEGTTLREHYGLHRPRSRYSAEPQAP